MAHVLSFYLYSQGATRQLFSVLNHLGHCVSYQTIAGRGGKSLADSDTEGDSTSSDESSDPMSLSYLVMNVRQDPVVSRS